MNKEMVNDFQKKFSQSLREKNTFTNLLEKAEKTTSISREHIVYGLIGLLVIGLLVDWTNLTCNLVGFLYPAYKSVQAIESTATDDDTKWLMYWCVYGLFTILEVFSDRLLYWIPLYSLTKCVFLIWLMIPGKQGGTFLIYNKVIKAFMDKHKTIIDQKIGEVKSGITKIVTNEINSQVNKNDYN